MFIFNYLIKSKAKCFFLSNFTKFSTLDKASTKARQHVAIVGSGPAAFYTAQQILKSTTDVNVDIYEKLPVPFGLVRFGVAPDHPEVKNVINTFNQTAENPRCSFTGNVTIGKDVSLSELRSSYSAVVLAYGAETDKTLGIPGETLPGVLSARSFVGWYNGLPEHRMLNPHLDVNTALILGQGNVAIDVARILLTPIDILQKTDITDYSVNALKRSAVRDVRLVGRRGPLQAAFTTAEFREMTKLDGCYLNLQPNDFTGLEDQLKGVNRARKRLTELMIKSANSVRDSKEINEKVCSIKFLRSPIEFLPTADGKRLGAVRFEINEVKVGEAGVRAVPSGEFEEIPCGLALRSIGYKGVRIDPELPFDETKGIVPNTEGRVTDCPDLYCSGWIKRGPTGVIASTMTDSFQTAKHIIDDLLNTISTSKQGKKDIEKLLADRGIKHIDWSQWEKISAFEFSKGEEKGKTREKITDVDELLNIVSR